MFQDVSNSWVVIEIQLLIYLNNEVKRFKNKNGLIDICYYKGGSNLISG